MLERGLEKRHNSLRKHAKRRSQAGNEEGRLFSQAIPRPVGVFFNLVPRAFSLRKSPGREVGYFGERLYTSYWGLYTVYSCTIKSSLNVIKKLSFTLDTKSPN